MQCAMSRVDQAIEVSASAARLQFDADLERLADAANGS